MKLHPATRAAQALHHLNAEGGVAPAIDLSSTFARDADYQPRAPYIYARDGGPTIRILEALLADLDEANHALAFSSGMAAITTLMETLRPGEGLAAPRIMYHGTLAWARHLAEHRGIELTLYAPGKPQEALTERTRLLWVETPANPTWDITDIKAAAKAAHAIGARLAVDCTAAPPSTTQSLTLGADIAFHSATKYMGGHSDLTAGTLALND
ncbi:MAG: aminotransferase class V-fold PLP-dependent enzyme, partial [Pseudomonadota bacterium]